MRWGKTSINFRNTVLKLIFFSFLKSSFLLLSRIWVIPKLISLWITKFISFLSSKMGKEKIIFNLQLFALFHF